MLRALLFTLCLAVAQPAQADQTAHLLAAEEMMEATQARAMIAPTLELVRDQIKSQFNPESFPLEQRPMVAKSLNDMLTVFDEEFSWEVMKPVFAAAYVKNFSEKEIREVIAFYRTPTGQKLLAKTPLITQETTTFTQQALAKAMTKIKAIISELGARTGRK